ncbi:MAG: WD40 repeat domain-containing protein [Planctomycetes bacterium]|nr:WD40 repeat domain-containing protein [Planctomycetota bacterium]
MNRRSKYILWAPVILIIAAAVGLPLHGPSSAQPGAKAAIPAAAEQAKALKLVLDVFGDDLENATTKEAKARLAATLFQQGKEVKDDKAVRYVCFREARDLAARANDTSLALVIVDEMTRLYDLDALSMKADLLGLAVASATQKEQGLALVEVLRPLLNEAVDLDHYKAAHQLGEALIAAAKKARSPSLVLELQKRIEEIKGIEKNFAKLQGYLDRVQKNPNDAEANLELGQYFAFQKKRWEKSLKYFAACQDKPLAAMAAKDLIGPKETRDQLAVADGWWALADSRKGPEKLALQMRAMSWYDKALPNLAGLNRTKAQKRIDIVQSQLVGAPVVPVAVGPVGEVRKFEGHTDEVKGVAFSIDGRHVASCSRDLSVRVWDVLGKSAKETQIIRGHTKEVWAVAFHPNNRYLFSVSWDTTARMWDFKTGNEQKRFTHAKDVNGIALSRDASSMLIACDDEKVYLWNVTTGEEIRRFVGHSNYVYAVAFSPDGRYVASGGVDKTVRVFDLRTAQLVKSFEGSNESITNIAFLADSKHVISAGDSVIHVWSLQTGKEVRRFEGHQGRIPAMALSPDGRRLLTGGDDRTIKLWDALTGKVLHSFTGHTDTVTTVAFSPDGRRAVSGSYDRTVRVWNLPGR